MFPQALATNVHSIAHLHLMMLDVDMWENQRLHKTMNQPSSIYFHASAFHQNKLQPHLVLRAVDWRLQWHKLMNLNCKIVIINN